ncbi:MAG: hypothetical protein KC442_21075 [Thermomicrobiales bacterium]|nr:hypothetical protein [Thermomicrobiales bacterium]
MDTCKRCDGDGWIEVMDPDHYGAVIGVRECPDCGGTGRVWPEGKEDAS